MAGGRGREIGGRLWTSGIWAQSENKPELREREKRKGKGFQIFKSKQPNESKHKFEFKHSKTMHQHVCNIKLL
jgi:hypothetical protein